MSREYCIFPRLEKGSCEKVVCVCFCVNGRMFFGLCLKWCFVNLSIDSSYTFGLSCHIPFFLNVLSKRFSADRLYIRWTLDFRELLQKLKEYFLKASSVFFGIQTGHKTHIKDEHEQWGVMERGAPPMTDCDATAFSLCIEILLQKIYKTLVWQQWWWWFTYEYECSLNHWWAYILSEKGVQIFRWALLLYMSWKNLLTYMTEEILGSLYDYKNTLRIYPSWVASW